VLTVLVELLKRAARDHLARDEPTTPLLAALEGLAEPALVRTNGKEADDEHPERDTEDETYEECVHDRRPLPPFRGGTNLLNRFISNCRAMFLRCFLLSKRRKRAPCSTHAY
jgi:hypothetical protein